jgi:hypothetical protein
MNPATRLAQRIHLVRGQRVMLSGDLAELYGVEPRALTQAVRRNLARFPPDFAFFPTKQELAILKSQTVISSWGGSRSLPLAFTEHGTIMAATVLRSTRALEVSILVVRAFVQMRGMLLANAELGKRLDQLESRIGSHDRAIGDILTAIRQLTQPPDTPRRRRIGFV